MMKKKQSRSRGKPAPRKIARNHQAFILSPDEVELRFAGFPEEGRAAVRGRWMLAGAVDAAMLEQLAAVEGEDIAAEVYEFPCPSGAVYTVITCQLGNLQHRFVLPMYEERVLALLTTAVDNTLSIYLESKELSRQGIAYDCPIRPTRFPRALGQCQKVNEEQKVLFSIEFPSVIATVTALDMIPSLNGTPVSGVDASFFLPSPYLQLVSTFGLLS